MKDRKSNAKQVRELLQKQKGLLKSKQKLTDFKEPVAMLIRRSGDVEWYEGATQGKFRFEHSDGDMRSIDLIPSRMLNFNYSDRKVRWYFLHEDYPLPLPDDPIVTSELIAVSQEKAMHDINKFRLQEAKVKSGASFKIFVGIAIVIGSIALALVLIPDSFWKRVFEKGTEDAQGTYGISIFALNYIINRCKYGVQRT